MSKVNQRGIHKPDATKSSARRQELALQKKLQSLTLLADEVLYCIFKYITISDLLRCSCVSKTWLEIASSNHLWDIQFKRLPKQTKGLSTRAKTVGCISWKEECIASAKKRRVKYFDKVFQNLSNYPPKPAKVPITKALGIRWLLQFVDAKSKHYEVVTREDFSFNMTLSVRWNSLLDLPPVSELVEVNLFLLTPLFFDKDAKPLNDSICTKVLIMSQGLKGIHLDSAKVLGEDEHVSIRTVSRLLHLGLWKSSYDIAFAGMSLPVHELKTAINGLQGHAYPAPLSPDTALLGQQFTVVLELRNSRKSFFYEIYRDFSAGTLVGDSLEIRYERDPAYAFYDIKEELVFTWKTVALKGLVKGVFILDVNVYDNNRVLWCGCSSPVTLNPIQNERDNYSFENAEVWRVEGVWESGRCCLDMVRNSETMESTIKAMQILLQKSSR